MKSFNVYFKLEFSVYFKIDSELNAVSQNSPVFTPISFELLLVRVTDPPLTLAPAPTFVISLLLQLCPHWDAPQCSLLHIFPHRADCPQVLFLLDYSGQLLRAASCTSSRPKDIFLAAATQGPTHH